jgi:sugar phosphate isomerase/epimerase
MRLTCSSLSLYSLSPDAAIATIAELGFPALDLVSIPTLPDPHIDVIRRDPSELSRLARVAEHAGIEVATVVTLPTDGQERWDLEEVRARIRWAVQACQALGARRLVLDAGNPIPGDPVPRPQALARWKSMVDSGFEVAVQAGVALAIEAPHTGTLAERFDQVEELLEVMALPDVGLDYDTSHVHRSGRGIDESLRLVGDRVVKVALRDVDEDDEFCRPGTGLVEFDRLIKRLRDRQFSGDLVIELETPGVTERGALVDEIAQTRAFVEELLDRT